MGQSELAERVGVSPRTIRAWEYGNNAPKGRKFPHFSTCLGSTCLGWRRMPELAMLAWAQLRDLCA